MIKGINTSIRNNKAITLIALIVIIVVLIMLAGITINMILGKNGILTKAKFAVEENKKAKLKEEIQLVLADIITKCEANNEQLTKQIIKQKLETSSKLSEITINDNLEIMYGGYEFWIDDNYQVHIVGEASGGENPEPDDEEELVPDDIVTWLRLANVENPEQYSTSEVFTNEQVMKKVMNNRKAVKYMLEGTTILTEVLKSDVAINEISLAINTLGLTIENQQIRTKLLSSETFITNIKTIADKIPELTSNISSIIQSGMNEDLTNQWGTTKWYYAFDDDNNTYSASISVGDNSIGTWIGYDFESPINVIQVTGKIRMKGYKIQYSDNNGANEGDWIDVISTASPGSENGNTIEHILTQNPGAHRYWRIYITDGQQNSNWGALIWELQFYGWLDKTLDANILNKVKILLQKAAIEILDEDIDASIFKNEEIIDLIIENAEAMNYMINNQELVNEVLKSDIILNKLSLSKTGLKLAILNQEIRTKLLSSETFITNIKTIADKVPTLTSNVSSIIQSGMDEDLTNQWGTSRWYQAFDDDNNTYSSSTSVGDNSIGVWIGYDFERPINVIQVTGKIRMKGYRIQYSDNNGTNEGDWIDVIFTSSPGSSNGNTIEHTLTQNPGAHRYWRIYVADGQQLSNWGALVWELQFYGI